MEKGNRERKQRKEIEKGNRERKCKTDEKRAEKAYMYLVMGN